LEADVRVTGTSRWSGNWKNGSGTLSTGSPIVVEQPYSFASRFEGADGAVPEELLAATYAGCLNQAFANVFGWGNFVADFIETTVEIRAELGHGDNVHGNIHITMRARIPGIAQKQIEGLANTARKGCLISRFLRATATMDATLLK
jgi:osmotically inducible protein OsmC